MLGGYDFYLEGVRETWGVGGQGGVFILLICSHMFSILEGFGLVCVKQNLRLM